MEKRQAGVNGEKPAARLKSSARPDSLARDLLSRIDKAEGQLRGIKRMLSDNSYCIDVLQQIAAVRGALQKLALILLRDHLESCVTEAMAQNDSSGKIQEVIDTLDRFVG